MASARHMEVRQSKHVKRKVPREVKGCLAQQHSTHEQVASVGGIAATGPVWQTFCRGTSPPSTL